MYKLERTYLSKKLKPNALFVAVFSFMIMLLISSFDTRGFEASGKLIFEQKEYWRAFTSALLHADLNHLSHNAFFFTGLAFILNGYFGLWVFPTLAILMGGLINLITISFYPPEVHLVGVSGVVYFMASFWLTAFLLIERRPSITKRIIYVVGMSFIFFFPESFYPDTSYLAHGVGFILGIPSALIYFAFNFKRIRAEEVWHYRPDLPVDYDWQERKEEGEIIELSEHR